MKDELEALSVGMFRKIIKAGKPLAAFLRSMEIDDQFFFKGAPLVIGYPDVKYRRTVRREKADIHIL